MTDLVDKSSTIPSEVIVSALAALIPTHGWALELDRQVAAADKLREIAAASGDKTLVKFADLIAPPGPLRSALDSLDANFRAYQPEQTFGGAEVQPKVVLALHGSFQAVLRGQPRGPTELGRKVKAAALWGLLRDVVGSWPEAGSDMAQDFRLRWCVFHAIVGTDSTGWWARIPREGGHGFHGIVGASRLRG